MIDFFRSIFQLIYNSINTIINVIIFIPTFIRTHMAGLTGVIWPETSMRLLFTTIIAIAILICIKRLVF